MIARFDHAIIAVRDLPRAVERWRGAGFEVRQGGRHEGRGTANAIVRFGLDYLELITVEHRPLALAGGGNSAALVRYLDAHEAGLIGYALATDTIEQAPARFAEQGILVPPLIPRDRLLPGGDRLRWRLAIPGGQSWLTPWPMLIQWDTTDAERLRWEAPGHHRNGVSGVGGIQLRAADPDLVERVFVGALGLPARRTPGRTTFPVGACLLEVAPAADGDGGPTTLVLSSADLDRTAAQTGGVREDVAVRLPAASLDGVSVLVRGV
ncbi:MAG: VOC family protein [Candidatus Dormiibacterota bacterium]